MIAASRGRGALVALAATLIVCAVAGCDVDPGNDRRVARAAALTGGDPAAGRLLIRQYGCGSCHTIPGVAGADAEVGPPLNGIAGRVFIAGRLANTPENMARWISDPWGVDPATAMPDVGVSARDALHITAYLYTLR
jgi:cytochrome c